MGNDWSISRGQGLSLFREKRVDSSQRGFPKQRQPGQGKEGARRGRSLAKLWLRAEELGRAGSTFTSIASLGGIARVDSVLHHSCGVPEAVSGGLCGRNEPRGGAMSTGAM